jgi:hypothetical protein
MTMAAIREKLYDYIRVADDKKLKAIYMILEDDINAETAWWKDNAFVEELNKRYEAWENGKEKGYSMEEIEDFLAERKNKKQAK